MNEPLVSVIIPAYNAGRVLDRCLNSISSQATADIEIVVVNDGSTDDTAVLLRRWQEREPRLVVIDQPNQGVAAARNHALSVCRGEYVRFVDSDDELPPGAISDLLPLMRDQKADLAIGGFTKVVAAQSIERNILAMDAVLPIEEYLRLLNRWSNSFFCGVLWNKLFRRSLIEQADCRFRGDLTLGEDLDFCLQYLTACRSVALSTRSVYRYICNTAGLTYQHAAKCVVHPFRSIHMKWMLYKRLKALYVTLGQWPRYRRTLWLYLFRTTISN